MVRKKAGRPEFEPTADHRYSVGIMKAAGINNDVIARCVGISTETLAKHFADELSDSKAKLDARIVETLVNQALAGNTSLLMFYARTRLGMREEPSGDKARQLKAQADLSELELMQARGEMLHRDDVKRAWETTFSNIRDLIRQIPMAIADDIMAAAEDGRPAVYAAMKAAIDDALDRAAARGTAAVERRAIEVSH